MSTYLKQLCTFILANPRENIPVALQISGLTPYALIDQFDLQDISSASSIGHTALLLALVGGALNHNDALSLDLIAEKFPVAFMTMVCSHIMRIDNSVYIARIKLDSERNIKQILALHFTAKEKIDIMKKIYA